MKLSKSQLQQLIKEELENVLEAEAKSTLGKFLGKFTKKDYAEDWAKTSEAPTEDPNAPSGMKPGEKAKADVTRVMGKMEKAPGLDKYLQKIDTRIELEQFLRSILKTIGPKMRLRDIFTALYKATLVVKQQAKK